MGSIVAGPKEFIGKVLKIRKMLGGGTRQAGVIAAPGDLPFLPEGSIICPSYIDSKHHNSTHATSQLSLCCKNVESSSARLFCCALSPRACSRVLSCTGLLAVTDMSRRLHIDHENAQILAKGLAEMPLIDLDPKAVHSNIVVFRLK